jgi:hypothetical protein
MSMPERITRAFRIVMSTAIVSTSPSHDSSFHCSPRAKNDDTITAYNDQVAAVRKRLDGLYQQVSANANRLINLNPPVDRNVSTV